VGAGIVVAIVAAFVGLYAVSYPLSDWIETTQNHLLPPGPAELVYLALAAIGLAVAAARRRGLAPRDLVLATALAAPVWLSIQAMYWQNGWTPFIPFYDPTLHAVETGLMVLGGLALARGGSGISMPAADGRFREAGRAIVVGLAIGLVLAGANLVLLFAGGASPADGGPAGLVRALKPGILEEVAYRFLFLGMVLTSLRGAMAPRRAAIVAITLSAAFHAAVHVPELFVSDPLPALAITAFTGLVFGVPLAILAYRRGIEASITAHWTIDAVRFALGL